MAAALCYGVGGGSCQLCFHVQPGSYNTDSLIEVLKALRTFLGGQKATLLWDGLPSHRSNRMLAWIASQRDWLVVERLPAYAPELNPVGATRGRFRPSGSGRRRERRSQGQNPDQCPGLSPLRRALLVTVGCEARSQSPRGGPAIGSNQARRRLEG
jgi:hypothetical protein